MPGGTVDELLDVAVESPVFEQFEVEVGRTAEDRIRSGPAGDHREDRHLEAVDEAGGHQRPVQRQASVLAQRNHGLLLEPGDDVDGVAADDGRVRSVEAFSSVDRGRHAPHPAVHGIDRLGPHNAGAQHLDELPERGGTEDFTSLDSYGSYGGDGDWGGYWGK